MTIKTETTNCGNCGNYRDEKNNTGYWKEYYGGGGIWYCYKKHIFVEYTNRICEHYKKNKK